MTDILAEPLRALDTPRCLLGEGACFSPVHDRLFWLDIKGHKLFSMTACADDLSEYPLPDLVSAIAPARSGGFVCARRKGFSLLDPDAAGPVRLTPIVDLESDLPGNRFNDGKLDPAGHFWAGSMDDAEDRRTGQWWRLAPDGSAEKVGTGFMVTNGPAFDPDNGIGYCVDSADRVIFRFAPAGAGFESREVFLTFTDRHGYPDGLTIDREGCLWVAFWDGSCVRRFSPAGALLDEVPCPARRPTSIEIIGDRLFVTSATIGLPSSEEGPGNGRLLAAPLRKVLGREARPLFDDSQLARTR